MVTRESGLSGVVRLQARPGSMVNTYLKGNRNEKLFRTVLEKEGYITWKPSRAKYNSNDVFGLFDCVAIRGGEVLLAQVKSHVTDFYKARKETQIWHDAHRLMINVVIALYEGNNVWRIEWYDWLNKEWTKYPLTN